MHTTAYAHISSCAEQFNPRRARTPPWSACTPASPLNLKPSVTSPPSNTLLACCAHATPHARTGTNEGASSCGPGHVWVRALSRPRALITPPAASHLASCQACVRHACGPSRALANADSYPMQDSARAAASRFWLQKACQDQLIRNLA